MLKVGVIIDKIIEVTHPLVTIIKSITGTGRGEVTVISIQSQPEELSELLNINIEKIYFIEDIENLNLELDIYFSSTPSFLYKIQSKGFLGGYINLESDECQIAFDHRLFLDKVTYIVMEDWLELIGYLQKETKIKVSLVTTRQCSVSSEIRNLFKKANCKIDLICFLAVGEKKEIIDFFSPCLYFEGEKRDTMNIIASSNPLLFV